MGAACQEFPQARRRARNGVRSRDADRIEALRAGNFGKRALDRSRGQKSRLV
jgi:hypothetical protein